MPLNQQGKQTDLEWWVKHRARPHSLIDSRHVVTADSHCVVVLWHYHDWFCQSLCNYFCTSMHNELDGLLQKLALKTPFIAIFAS